MNFIKDTIESLRQMKPRVVSTSPLLNLTLDDPSTFTIRSGGEFRPHAVAWHPDLRSQRFSNGRSALWLDGTRNAEGRHFDALKLENN